MINNTSVWIGYPRAGEGGGGGGVLPYTRRLVLKKTVFLLGRVR